jgi:hypothetical protein
VVRAPLQGLVDFLGFTQGVALGCDRARRWRGLAGVEGYVGRVCSSGKNTHPEGCGLFEGSPGIQIETLALRSQARCLCHFACLRGTGDGRDFSKKVRAVGFRGSMGWRGRRIRGG